MALPLIPLLGPLLVRGLLKTLPGRLAETWAPRIAKAIGVALIAGLLWLAVSLTIGAIRKDARADLLAEQAAERAKAERAQRAAERAADDRRRTDLKTGTAADAAQHKELNDATQNLPDSRPTARQRARVCRELQQQEAAAGRPQRSC